MIEDTTAKLLGKRLTVEDLKPRSTGTSDNIPAVITDKKGKPIAPARLSEGEFVINAETVSKLGGGATDPGMEFLDSFQAYVKQMDRFQASDFATFIMMVAEEILANPPSEEELPE